MKRQRHQSIGIGSFVAPADAILVQQQSRQDKHAGCGDLPTDALKPKKSPQ
jgi:hypothetical protein